MPDAINFAEKFALFSEHWQPKVIAEMNDYQIKLARLEGEFVWHKHEDTDETFIVMEGKLLMELRHKIVEINKGEMFVVPHNTEHKPIAVEEALVMLIEPKGVINTGDASSERRAENDVWI